MSLWIMEKQAMAPFVTNMMGSYRVVGPVAKGTQFAFGQIEDDPELEVLQGRIGHWYLQSFTSTLARGTSEIQRTILATRGLGLPRS